MPVPILANFVLNVHSDLYSVTLSDGVKLLLIMQI